MTIMIYPIEREPLYVYPIRCDSIESPVRDQKANLSHWPPGKSETEGQYADVGLPQCVLD
jgi:hypothetical protein